MINFVTDTEFETWGILEDLTKNRLDSIETQEGYLSGR